MKRKKIKKLKREIINNFLIKFHKKIKIPYFIMSDSIINNPFYYLKQNKFNNRLKASFNNFIKDFNYDEELIKPSEFSTYFNNKTCRPFWNNKIEDLSNTLFFPYKFNIHKNNNLTSNFNKNKWFKNEFYSEDRKEIRLHDINYKPVNENKEINRTKQIQLNFNLQQKKVIKNFISCYRYIYNRTISYLNNLKNKNSFYLINPKDETTKIELFNIENPYNYYSMRTILLLHLPDWINNINPPVHLIRNGVCEAFENFNKCMSKLKKTNKPFNLKFKLRKDIIQTMNIESVMISKKQVLFTNYKIDNKKVFTENNIKVNLNKYNYGDSSISYNRILNRFYLNLSHKINTKNCENKKVCSLDPGVRNFITLYSENEVAKLGIDCEQKIDKLNKEIDIIRSRMNKKEYIGNNKKRYTNTNKRKRQLRKALERKQIKIKNIVKELHSQIVNYLTNNYSMIIHTRFESQKLVQKLNRYLSRIVNNLSYYKFKTRLQNKCEERNVKLEIKDEYFTSKTCTRCGNIKYNLGSNKIYNCSKCKLQIERDYNGARNILLRNYESINKINFPLINVEKN